MLIPYYPKLEKITKTKQSYDHLFREATTTPGKYTRSIFLTTSLFLDSFVFR